MASLRRIPWNKGNRIRKPLTCHHCGIIFITSRLSRPHQQYCSIPCGVRASRHKVNFKGKNNPNWKGGITDKEHSERVRFREQLQQLIFERDGYRCQLCESTGDLQIDHIQAWAEFKELRFDPDNCRTLCAKCHYKITFHKDMPESVKAWGHNLGRRVAA